MVMKIIPIEYHNILTKNGVKIDAIEASINPILSVALPICNLSITGILRTKLLTRNYSTLNESIYKH